MTVAYLADGLTAGRFVLAILLAAALAADRLSTAAALVSAAWMSDLADGRLARSTPVETRLGDLDTWADLSVGVGAVVGLTFAGWLPATWGWGGLLFLGGAFLLTRVLALEMLLQALGYGALLLVLWSQRSGWWWLPFLTVLGALVVDHRRLVEYVLPTFFGSLRRP